MSRVTLTLREDEREALVTLALAELRTPRDQARHILRAELEKRGRLKTAEQGHKVREAAQCQVQNADRGQRDL